VALALVAFGVAAAKLDTELITKLFVRDRSFRPLELEHPLRDWRGSR
jgi:hypothetical protein